MTTEPAEDAFADLDDDLEADFAPPPLGEIIRDYLVRGTARRTVAEILGVSLDALAEYIAAETAQHGQGVTAAERAWLIDSSLEEITRLAYEALDSPRESVAPLLAVLVDVTEIRARLNASPR